MVEPWTIEFRSWGDFLTHVETAEPWHSWGNRSSRDAGRGSFHGGDSFEDTLSHARNGWRDGETVVRERTTSLVDRIASRIARADYVHDVVGETLDMGTYLTGRPDCWLREEITHVDGPCVKHVRVVLNTGCQNTVKAESLTARGIGIAAAVLLLECAGARVTVDAISAAHVYNCGGTDYDPHAIITVRVKDPDQDLDEGRLAFACAHPGMHRRMMFSVRETCPVDQISRNMHGNYGATINPQSVIDACDLYMPGMRDAVSSQPCDWNNTAAVERWIIATLASQGIELSE